MQNGQFSLCQISRFTILKLSFVLMSHFHYLLLKGALTHTHIFPIFPISTPPQIVLSTIDRHRTTFTSSEIMAVCTFYDISAFLHLILFVTILLLIPTPLPPTIKHQKTPSPAQSTPDNTHSHPRPRHTALFLPLSVANCNLLYYGCAHANVTNHGVISAMTSSDNASTTH